MQEREWKIPGGSLYYEITEKGAVITGFKGMVSEIRVPERIEDTPVTAIGRKVFLSRKQLRRASLPETVEEVGDWAFAYCDALEQVTLPAKPVRFGKSVFLGCGSLTRIADESSFLPAELLAAVVRQLDAYYLLDPADAGSEEWLKKWDTRLREILRSSDQEGYSKQVLCGEEDYGSTDLGAYVSSRRKRKVRLALLRCLFPQGLSQELEEEIKAYLLAHTKGGESEETWQVVLEEYGDHKEYYSLFVELGCLREENRNGILTDIGEKYPEMKAYFLRCREEQPGKTDFFEALKL